MPDPTGLLLLGLTSTSVNLHPRRNVYASKCFSNSCSPSVRCLIAVMGCRRSGKPPLIRLSIPHLQPRWSNTTQLCFEKVILLVELDRMSHRTLLQVKLLNKNAYRRRHSPMRKDQSSDPRGFSAKLYIYFPSSHAVLRDTGLGTYISFVISKQSRRQRQRQVVTFSRIQSINSIQKSHSVHTLKVSIALSPLTENG